MFKKIVKWIRDRLIQLNEFTNRILDKAESGNVNLDILIKYLMAWGIGAHIALLVLILS